jgi:hypothetical protein
MTRTREDAPERSAIHHHHRQRLHLAFISLLIRDLKRVLSPLIQSPPINSFLEHSLPAIEAFGYRHGVPARDPRSEETCTP